MTAEEKRLADDRDRTAYWRRWGPYLSERQWGTVREDYSPDGAAWDYFPHDHARSRAYRWGEDGIAGISDNHQRLCFAIALWNGQDPILKERIFGLTGPQGNHGEDVKEYYFYLDNIPSHAYMKYLYKYPQVAFPYDQLVRANQERGFYDPEFELVDTGIFDRNEYFDVFVEYAKQTDEDILIQIRVVNRANTAKHLHVLLEYPTGSGPHQTLQQVAEAIGQRLCGIFLRNQAGDRPVHGGHSLFQTDPHWRDLLLFYEYFHGDNGAGIGANHQTGWTSLVATLLHQQSQR